MSSANVVAALSLLALSALHAVDALESGRGRFGEVDLVLVTHAHSDHFDPAAVRRHLDANRQAVLVAPGDAVVAMHLERESSGIVSRLAELVPSAVILDEPGERVNGDC